MTKQGITKKGKININNDETNKQQPTAHEGTKSHDKKSINSPNRQYIHNGVLFVAKKLKKKIN